MILRDLDIHQPQILQVTWSEWYSRDPYWQQKLGTDWAGIIRTRLFLERTKSYYLLAHLCRLRDRGARKYAAIVKLTSNNTIDSYKRRYCWSLVSPATNCTTGYHNINDKTYRLYANDCYWIHCAVFLFGKTLRLLSLYLMKYRCAVGVCGPSNHIRSWDGEPLFMCTGH